MIAPMAKMIAATFFIGKISMVSVRLRPFVILGRAIYGCFLNSCKINRMTKGGKDKGAIKKSGKVAKGHRGKGDRIRRMKRKF